MLEIILFFIFGTIVGSFLNVLIIRGKWSATFGRSQCPSCGKILSALELVPIVSFLLQKRKCRKCDTHISFQYPIVEIITGALFALGYYLFGISIPLLVFLVAIFFLVPIVAIDIRDKVLYDSIVYPFIGFAFIFALGYSILNNTIVPLVAGPLLALPFFLIYFLSKGKAMGQGDQFLALGIGFLLTSYADVLYVFFLSFWIGAVIMLSIMIIDKLGNRKRFGWKSEVPFAPFLVLSFLVILAISGI